MVNVERKSSLESVKASFFETHHQAYRKLRQKFHTSPPLKCLQATHQRSPMRDLDR